MKQFFKFMFASCLGSFLMFFVISFLFIVSFGAMVGSIINSDNKTVEVKRSSVLELQLDKPIKERSRSELETALSGNFSHGLNTILPAIYEAKNDTKIEGIYIKTGSLLDAGWATIDEIRLALKDFRESGKFVYCYSDSYTQKAYFLATACDSIFLNPSGNMEFQGISAQVMFIKDLLDKLDVDIELIRPKSNAYKSAGEMYILSKMSEANKEQVRSYISSIWDYVITDISEARNIPINELHQIADNLTAYDQNKALEYGLIDNLIFEAKVKELIASKIDINTPNDISFVSSSKYKNSLPAQNAKDKIAVIYAEGNVKTGKGNLQDIYSENIIKSIDKALSNDDVKAIVLRVNSSGGEVLGSEIMTNAIKNASNKKPLIVSMGDVAASAGYEISCYASKIVAHPTTLTGSIGVFGIVPDFGKALKNKLGINIDTVLTNKNSASLTTVRPLSPTAKVTLEKSVENSYTAFCEHVAEGRGLTYATVEENAKGRVWTGSQALEIGFIDILGGINKALEIASEEADIEYYSIIEYPEQKDSFTQFREMLQESASMKFLGKKSSTYHKYFKELENISDMQGIQARLPFVVETY